METFPATGTKIVAFEGLNCTGKSTLSIASAETLQCEYVRTPPADAARARGLFVDPFSDAAMLFYYSWVKRLGEMVDRGMFGPVLICDRYLASTLSYFAAAENPAHALVKLFPTTLPALTVLVTVDELVRERRLAERRDFRKIDMETLRPDFRDRVLTCVRSFTPLIEIDTTSRDVSSCVGEVVAAIDRYFPH